MTSLTVTPSSVFRFQDVLSVSHSSLGAIEDAKENKKYRIIQYFKLGLSVCAIGAVLVALSVISVAKSLKGISVSGKMTQYVKVGDLVTALQNERAITCVFLGTGDQNDKLVTLWQVANRRSTVDLMFQVLPDFNITLLSNGNILSKMQLQSALKSARVFIDKSNASCEDIVDSYSDWNAGLLILLVTSLEGNDAGDFCSLVDAYYSILWATEFESRKTAYGGDYFMTAGAMPDSEYNGFIAALGVGPVLVSMARQRSPFLYSSLNAAVMATLAKTSSKIHPLESDIVNNAPYSNLTIALYWLDLNTQYQNLLNNAGNKTKEEIYRFLNEQAGQNRSWFIGVTFACIITVLGCPGVLFWYALKSDRLMQKVGKFNKEIKKKAAEAAQEKRITEVLLYQILPPHLADQLRAGGRPEPEYYEEATIFFSDIKGFTALSAKSSTSEIILLLNKLYTIFDAIVDRYDVYKVETIGDSYMIASGLPNRNGQQHSEQMATLALNILQEMSQFYIPHRPNERLLIRIGLHTGSCAAGIVGNKMPRYCLFGDTVNTASRMESTGEPNRIQISALAESHLTRNHPLEQFEMIPRGATFVKGKGNVKTYWLLGKREFPYRIDLEAVEDLVNKTEYWKSAEEFYTENIYEPEIHSQTNGEIRNKSGKMKK